MNMILILLLLNFIINLIKTQNIPYDLIMLPEIYQYQSKCLDGSDVGFYQYINPKSKKYIIYLQGGGACLGWKDEDMLESCLKRSSTPLGSSLEWKKQKEFEGMLSQDQNQNPQFYNWNKIYIPYCDGTFHTGHNEDSQIYKEKQIYFRGYYNTYNTFDYLIKTFKLDQSEDIILTGGSAGAMATFIWQNKLKKMINSKNTLFLSAPDSGYFPRLDDADDLIRFNVMSKLILQDKNLILPEECKYKNIPQESYKCIFMQYTMNIMSPKIPQLVYNSLYDSWTIYADWQMKCLSHYNEYSLENCNTEEMQKADQLYNLTKSYFQEIYQQYRQSSSWNISCVKHMFTLYTNFNDNNWSVNGYNTSDITYIWYRKQKQFQKANYLLQKLMNKMYTVKLQKRNIYSEIQNFFNQITQVFILDSTKYPNNTKCNGLSK